MAKVLIILAHPNISESKINKALIDSLADVKNVVVHDLYSKYPDFSVDVDSEQNLLLAYDTIIFQYPLYWYSCPALLKEWLDKVFVRNYAYGRGGKALEGKRLLSIVSAGGPEETYHTEGSNYHSVTEFLKPFEVTAKFCSMDYEEPLIMHNTYRATDSEIREHTKRYNTLLASYSNIQ